MKKLVLILLMFTVLTGFCPLGEAEAAYDFGDFRSVTLTQKAWAASKDLDLDAVLAYTNKCLEIYGEEAKNMQAVLLDYPEGSRDDIFAYWALNDVATCLFIQGETYRKVNMMDEAKVAFQTLINEYTYGQTWDSKGWFWKPAEAAKAKVKMIEAGVDFDFGDYKSETLIKKAWEAKQNGDVEAVDAYTNKCVEIYERTAKEMQSSLTQYPNEKEKIFSYFALNDVGTSLFIKGKAHQEAGNVKEAKKAYQRIIDEFYFAQTWDPQGWFWKPSEAAQEEMVKMK